MRMRKQLFFTFLLLFVAGILSAQMTEQELKAQKEKLQKQNSSLKKRNFSIE